MANSSSRKTSIRWSGRFAVPSTNAAFPNSCWSTTASIYCCQEITLICARVGCILRHTAVRDAAAKGKIERFFRRVRDQFLIRNLDLSSIESLNKQFTHWVEQDYNATVHSTLGHEADRPLRRGPFADSLSLSQSKTPTNCSTPRRARTVKKDNTFSFRGQRYETPVDLRGRKIQLRHERHRDGAVIVYEGGRRIGKARLLDAVANGLARRKEQA